jgi:hypothetical protein
VNHRDTKPDSPLSTELVETLVWLAGSAAIDRRAHTIMNRLRKVHDSESFGTLPEDLRTRVREILADQAG